MPLLTQYQTFFVSPFGEASVTAELNAFLRSHRIVNLEKRLVDGERGTGWLFLVEYATASPAQGSSGSGAPRVDWRGVLTEKEYAIFDHLRTLRKTLAEQQGIPVYNVFTNEQLASMARKSPRNLSDLAAVPGVGDARIKQFGTAILDFFSSGQLATVPVPEPHPSEPTAAGTTATTADAPPGPAF